MELPKKISPNPLVTSTVEIRFSINIDPSKLFSVVYPSFASELPSFEENKIPKEIRMQQEQLMFFPDYILRNEEFSLSFSNNVISFENVTEYKLWNNYFPFIEKQLNKFFSLNIVESISRIGVRYASVFDGKTKIDEVLNFTSKVAVEGYEQSMVLMRLDFKKANYNFHVQLAGNGKAIKNNKSLSGVYIDVDSSYTANLNPNSDILRIIDELHDEGKVLFFTKLLKPSFLETLNPTY
jgi:uncharacterized protein (TIGR04255 family)